MGYYYGHVNHEISLFHFPKDVGGLGLKAEA